MPGMQQKRGLASNLPVEDLAGVLLIATDTAELYGGQGAGLPLLQFSPKRYSVGSKSHVLATGLGVTITKLDNTCVINIPPSVQVISASIHFTAAEIASNTNCLITYSDETDYDLICPPQFQVWADVNNSRAAKMGVAGNLNIAANILEITALDEDQAIWINLSF